MLSRKKPEVLGLNWRLWWTLSRSFKNFLKGVQLWSRQLGTRYSLPFSICISSINKKECRWTLVSSFINPGAWLCRCVSNQGCYCPIWGISSWGAWARYLSLIPLFPLINVKTYGLVGFIHVKFIFCFIKYLFFSFLYLFVCIDITPIINIPYRFQDT